MKFCRLSKLMFFAALGLTGLSGGSVAYLQLKPRPPQVVTVQKRVYVKDTYYTREGVNRQIRLLMEAGMSEQVLDIYSRITGDRQLAGIILREALAMEIPVNLLFAVVRKESRFRRSALGIYGEIGLMQLHPQVFATLISDHGEGYLWNAANNVHWGARHLRLRYEQLGDWDFAVLRYNGAGREALEYMLKVQDYERRYDRLFNSLSGIVSVPEPGVF